jgi:8-oxo-dGTP diphosphatase
MRDLAAPGRRNCATVDDAHIGVYIGSIADGRRPSAELRLLDRRQYRQPLFQKSDGDPVAMPKPVFQIFMTRPGPHLILDNAQDAPENQVIVVLRRSAARNRIGVSPKLRDGIALAPYVMKIAAHIVHECTSDFRLKQMRNVAVIILYDNDSRILLQHRTRDAPTFPDHWAFFGGGIEDGETAEQALKREALEELDYRLTAPRLFGIRRLVHQDNEYKVHVFVEEYSGGKLILGEGQAMGWFLTEETNDLLMNDHDRSVIDSLKGFFGLS